MMLPVDGIWRVAGEDRGRRAEGCLWVYCTEEVAGREVQG